MKTELLKIISGEDQRLSATIVRWGLSCLTPFYRVAIGWRNRQYDLAIENQDQHRIQRADVPVISVGNLTTGGTGKTPHVVAFAKELRRAELRVALVSRGYGSDATKGSRNDEAMELEIRLPDVPHLQDPDRHAMACIAVDELESQVILMDDGFQHRKLHRDLDIVIVDATLPFGFGRLLPRGLLREPVASLRRADWVILSRVDQVSEAETQAIYHRLEKHVARDRIVETRMHACQAITASGKNITTETLKQKKVLAFCGIGNPENFLNTLRKLEVAPKDAMFFPDHHGYQRSDIASIGQRAAENDIQQIVCTQKDLVKLGVDQINGIPLAAISIEVRFVSDPNELFESLRSVAASDRP